MAEETLNQNFADRIGGEQFGKSTEIYKFEKIKRAKTKAIAANGERAYANATPEASREYGTKRWEHFNLPMC